MDNELLEFDRINVIKDTIKKYGEDNFYLSFSGGKDSTILHYLLDIALPNNRIPRVFINTGIEYLKIVEFVKNLASKDDRFVIIAPSVNVKQMLEKYGYPFKSKQHSHNLMVYQHSGLQGHTVKKYLGIEKGNNIFICPEKLRYQFTPEFKLKVSDQCCMQMKKKPIAKWEKENHRHIGITGMRNSEGGERMSIKSCILLNSDGSLHRFHPLIKVNSEWEDWFIEKHKIELCELYKEPYNFKRTGCRFCPFSLDLQHQLDLAAEFLKADKIAGENMWKPVFDEYRRIGYRLKNGMTIWD